mmetsp:Transcript_1441/g.3196  ORF Transcript_1441/g.3196 Transcript_1441/m.3196 type:complete len:402 (-) Transcript_1441:73-1278(-)
MNVYCDTVSQEEQDSWRRTKRGADEQMKGVPASSVGVAKRNRSALVDITNALGSRPATRSDKARSAFEANARRESGGSERWTAAASGGDAMVLSPGLSNAVKGISQRLSDRLEVQSEPEEGPSGLFEQDRMHADDPQFCVEYVDEIFEHLLATEERLQPTPTYMDTVQHDINPTMRGILIDWLVEVAEEYKLSSENLFLSQNYVDRFLSVMPVLRGRLQLVGVTCMLIASKYEEIFAPGVEDFVYITDSTYSASEVLTMESVVLNALRFNLTAVTPYTFVRRIATLLSLREETRHLAEFLAEITIQEFQYVGYKPSIIAFSAVTLAVSTMEEEAQHSVMLRKVMDTWGMSREAMAPCCRSLHATHCNIFDKTRALQASFEKFSHSKWSRVSLLNPKRTCPV